MEVKRITATFGGTVQVADYQPAHFSVTVEAELQSHEDVHAAIAGLQDIARSAVLMEVEDLETPRKATWLKAVRSASDPDDLPY
jgi:hypothetical protein